MKKLFVTAVLLTSLMGISQEKKAPEKWRTLTFGSTTGSTIDGHAFTQGTVSLDYELKNNFSISSWNGINYNFHTKTGWLSSQTTVDKRWGKFLAGAGFMYGSGYSVIAQPSNDLFVVVKLQYRIKL